MNIQLVKSQNKFILVSDEEIKEGWNGYAYKADVVGQIFKHFYTTNQWYNDAKIIIAGIPSLPSIDFSLLSEADCKTIGLSTIDLTKLCYYDQRNPDFQIKEEFGYDKEEVDATGNFAKKDCACDNCFYGRAKLTEQLITAKPLNDKRFSLEDMKNAFIAGNKRGWSGYPNTDNHTQPNLDTYIQSLQQTSWDVEIETCTMNKGYTDKDDFPYQECKIPKITNSSIKVIKIL